MTASVTKPCVLYLPPEAAIPEKAVLLNLEGICTLLDAEVREILDWIEQGKLHALLTDDGLRFGLGVLPEQLEGVEELPSDEVSELLAIYRR